MEKVTTKYENLCKALDALAAGERRYKIILKDFHADPVGHHEIADIHRDSLIKRFELCFDLTWKYVAIYLDIVVGARPEVLSPRVVFTAACAARILTEEQSSMALRMIMDRNQTVHIYREEIADMISMHVESYLNLMLDIAQQLKPPAHHI